MPVPGLSCFVNGFFVNGFSCRYSKKSNVTAASAAVAVMPKPTSGSCPWLTAKDVITPAPKAATTTEPSQSFCELLYITVVCDL